MIWSEVSHKEIHIGSYQKDILPYLVTVLSLAWMMSKSLAGKLRTVLRIFPLIFPPKHTLRLPYEIQSENKDPIINEKRKMKNEKSENTSTT